MENPENLITQNSKLQNKPQQEAVSNSLGMHRELEPRGHHEMYSGDCELIQYHQFDIEQEPRDGRQETENNKKTSNNQRGNPINEDHQMMMERKLGIAEQVLEMMQINGRYQYLLLSLNIIYQIASAFQMVMVSYLAPEPSFECVDSWDSRTYSSCSEAEACKMMREGQNAKMNLLRDSWTYHYQVYCDKASVRTSALMAMLLIGTLFPFPFLYLVDVYGRKFAFMTALPLTLGSAAVCFFADSFFLKVIGVGVWNGVSVMYSTTFIMLAYESSTSTSKMRSVMVGAANLSYGIGSILINLIAYISTTPNFLMGVTLSLSSFVGVASLFLVESPLFMLGKNEYHHFHTYATKISHFNKKKWHDTPGYKQKCEELKVLTDNEKKLQTIKEKKSWLKKYPILVLVSSKKYATRCLLLMLIGTNLYCVYYGLSINISNIGIDDIRINGIILGFNQTLGYAVITFQVHRIKRKLWTIILNSVMLLGTVSLLAISLSQPGLSLAVRITQSLITGVLLGAPMAGLFIVFYLLLSESFPPQLRGSANSVVITVSNVLSMAAPLMGKVASDLKIHYAVGCSALGILAVPFSFFLTETLHKQL